MEFVTVREAALLLRVSPVTIRRYIASGRLPAVRVGKGVRVNKEEIERLPEPVAGPGASRRDVLTPQDPIWSLVGIGKSDLATGVSEDKYKYVADAHAAQDE